MLRMAIVVLMAVAAIGAGLAIGVSARGSVGFGNCGYYGGYEYLYYGGYYADDDGGYCLVRRRAMTRYG
jgi:hypothetical protein